MRKFNGHQPRSLRFRLLLVVAGALLLAGAFVPRTHAAVIAYWNFDDSRPPPSHGKHDFRCTRSPRQYFDARRPSASTPTRSPDMRTDAPGPESR